MLISSLSMWPFLFFFFPYLFSKTSWLTAISKKNSPRFWFYNFNDMGHSSLEFLTCFLNTKYGQTDTWKTCVPTSVESILVCGIYFENSWITLFGRKFFSLFIFGYTEDWTQVLTNSWTTPQVRLILVCFSDRIWCFCSYWPWTRILLPMPPK
jgi:hypothetical protein